MPVTRDQASRLLTQPEMVLFGDSRNPALRALTASGLGKRIERVRKLRDKSRDLLQRQRLSSRDRTGSKRGVSGDANDRTRRKGEVLADILQRFEARLKDVERADKLEAKREAAAAAAAAKSKGAVRKTAAVKRAALPARAKKVATRPVGATRAAAKAAPGTVARKAVRPATAKSNATVVKKAGGGKTKPAGAAVKAAASGRDAVSRARPKPAKRAAPAAITPKRALANTRALLEAKQRHDAEPKAWQALGGHADHEPHVAGLPSVIAAAKAEELHAGESRMNAIEGSISTRDRQNQGKRDSR